MNFVVIFTDTQCKWMVGAYGQPVCDTPNLDKLAAQGVLRAGPRSALQRTAPAVKWRLGQPHEPASARTAHG